jgi:cytochrome c oxidase assembly protein subunit 15
MVKPMVVLFLLGGLQGVIGWLMVQSGLNDENLYVSHIRLAVHFTAALGLLVYTFWFAMQLLISGIQHVVFASSKKFLAWIIGLLVLQLVYGAFMAGLKAALVAPTWPDINGSYLPSLNSYRGESHTFFSSLVNNPIAVHFVHRNLAYLITLLVLIWSLKAAKFNGGALFNAIKWSPLVLVVIQVGLGIAAVLTSIKKVPQQWGVFEWMAQVHQVMAMLLLLSLVSVYFLHTKRQSAATAVSSLSY